MRKTQKFDDLPFLPHMMAETVCSWPYDGREWSSGLVKPGEAAAMDALRDAMTREQVVEFASLCDAKCRLAHERKSKWWVKILNANGNAGRDQLYLILIHWMTSYLTKPENLRAAAGTGTLEWPASALWG